MTGTCWARVPSPGICSNVQARSPAAILQTPATRIFPDLARLGFPIGEVGEDGSLVITKVAGSGGAVTRRLARSNLLYEVHDPTRYLQPDVTGGFFESKG
jgi:hypothetical protein